MAFTDNNTLKELVDETTLIKDDVTNNRDTLKANLENKGIETTEVSKLPDLIDKVNEIEVEKHKLPPWIGHSDTYFYAEPYNSHSSAYATVGNKIYVITGQISSSYIYNNKCYDVITNTWEDKKDIITPRRGAVASVINENIYVVGGFSRDGTYYVNQRYNTAVDSWKQMANMPSSKAYFSLNTIDNKMYAIGGATSPNGYTTTTVNEQYDSITDTWSKKTSIPVGKRGAYSAVIDEKIYVIAGSGSGGSDTVHYSSNYMYDTVTDTWSLKTEMPVIGAYGIAATHNNSIYVIGGHTYQQSQPGSSFLDIHYKYDSITETWEQKMPLPYKIRYSSGGIYNGFIYVIGGQVSDGTAFPINQVYII